MVVMDIERTREDPAGSRGRTAASLRPPPWQRSTPSGPPRPLRADPVRCGRSRVACRWPGRRSSIDSGSPAGPVLADPDPPGGPASAGWLEQATGPGPAGRAAGGDQGPADPGPGLRVPRRSTASSRRRPPTVALACGALIECPVPTAGDGGSHRRPHGRRPGRPGRRRSPGRPGQLDRATARGPNGTSCRAEVERQAERPRRRWPSLEPAWLPRTQESLRAGLAGGAVELSARVDLAIGRPLTAQGIGGPGRSEVRGPPARAPDDRHFYALVEALRSPAPPFVVATYYTRTGELDVDPVSTELLVESARRTAVGMGRMRQLAEGAPSRPGDRCSWCALQTDCPPDGQPLRSPGSGGSPPPEDR